MLLPRDGNEVSMDGPTRPVKRVRQDESFFAQQSTDLGSFLRVALKSGKPFRSKGWPWVQVGVRGILGGVEKVEKAVLLADGCLLVKTKNQKQTEKFLKATFFGEEECEVVRDSKLNQSKGVIFAHDLIDLSEEEVVGWLREFGVVGANRLTRKNDGKEENTPTLLLTFNRPTCPTKMELDYITYHVKLHIPNPLMCFGCGQFGHPELGCKKDKVSAVWKGKTQRSL